MKHFKLLLLVCSFLLSQNLFSQIEVEQYKLSNGLTVILNENHEKPEVFGAVIVDAGGKDDPSESTGMAHYMEHMLFKGTEELGTTNWEAEKPLIDSIFYLYDQLPKQSTQAQRDSIQKLINGVSLRAAKYAIPNELDAVLRSMGSTGINAGTGPDNTSFYNMFPPSQIGKWLNVYAHRFEKPVFRSFQAELEVVYEEKNMYSDQFFSPLLEEYNRNFFKNHPYGQQTLIGTVEDLKKPSLSKMKEFFDNWYAPNNMALVIVGDFDTDAVKPMIEASFGKLKYKEVPEHKQYPEEPFQGREFVEVKMSPVKVGLIGFRTVTQQHEDKVALDVCNYLVSNSGQTGLVDKLILDNNLLAAQMIDMPYSDHGSTLLLIVPKIVGQKLEEAEQLVLKEIEKIRTGEFDDALLDMVKKEIYRNHMLSLEDSEDRGRMFADAWAKGESYTTVLDYPKKVKEITKEDIVRVAKKYYGDNYLAFHSKMGSHKPEKVEKPGFKPLVVNTNVKSEFRKEIEAQESVTPKPNFVDFSKDIESMTLENGSKVTFTKNPQNDIFSLTLRYEIGTTIDPMLSQVGTALDYMGTEQMSVDSLKRAMALIGCELWSYVDESYTYYELEGLEENLEKAVPLLSQLLESPKLNPDKMSALVDEAKTDRKFEKSEVDTKGEALYEYALYGDKSSYLNRLSLKEVKKLEVDELIDLTKKIPTYEMEVFYTGKKSAEEVLSVLNNKLYQYDNPIAGNGPVYRESKEYKKNKIYFIDSKKSTQCKMYFYINGKPYSKEQMPKYNAFNFYFSGSFSGLVLQEIREYRSLAYSAGAKYRMPIKEGQKSRFVGYIGSQADKTIEALQTFNGLIRDMPEKSERMENIKTFLYQQSLSSRPSFRSLPEEVSEWKMKGFTQDPNIKLSEEYKDLAFSDLVEFEKENLKNEPMVICIAGDKRKVDMEELKKFGEVTFVKDKELFR